MLSARDAEALAKTLAAAGLEPSKAMPIFVGAKIACLFGYRAWSISAAVLLGYPIGKQVLLRSLSLVVAMMLPNWVIATDPPALPDRRCGAGFPMRSI